MQLPHYKYGSHYPHLYRLIDTTLLYVCGEMQPTAVSTSHVIVISVPETYMSARLHIQYIYHIFEQHVTWSCTYTLMPTTTALLLALLKMTLWYLCECVFITCLCL